MYECVCLYGLTGAEVACQALQRGIASVFVSVDVSMYVCVSLCGLTGA